VHVEVVVVGHSAYAKGRYADMDYLQEIEVEYTVGSLDAVHYSGSTDLKAQTMNFERAE
jgi:hypothetical protein